MNKGVLKKTKAGWFVMYQVMRDEITSGYDSIPLHPDSQTWMDGYNLYEGKEVEFEVRVYPSGSRFAKTIDEDDLGCSYPECICQGNEITDCKNRTPKQRQTMNKAQTPDQVVLGDKTALVEGIGNLNRHTQQVDFSNLNADRITSNTTSTNLSFKAKAEELVIKMYQPLPASKEAQKGKEHLYYNQFNAAKQCAFIAVEEILSMSIMSEYGMEFTKQYWEKIRRELIILIGTDEK